MIAKKIALGQFFTKGEEWLKPQVIKFVEKTGCSIAYDIIFTDLIQNKCA